MRGLKSQPRNEAGATNETGGKTESQIEFKNNNSSVKNIENGVCSLNSEGRKEVEVATVATTTKTGFRK